MGRRGPKTTPTALKIERGNPGKRALNQDEPDIAPAPMEPPAHLKGRALKEWKRLGPELVEKGVLTIGDLAVFETYCQLVADVDAYERLVRKVGKARAHFLGYANYLLKLRAQQKQYAAELGLTPSSRSGVKAAKSPATVDPKRARFFGNGGA